MLRKGNSWEGGGNDPKNNRTWKILATLFAGFILVILFRERILIAYGDWLSYSVYKGEADVAVSQNPQHGRLETAIQMYLNEEVSALVIVATPPRWVRKQIELNKITDSSRIYEGQCFSGTTFSDALHAKETIENHNLNAKSIVVVTDKYAIRRVRWVFQKVFGSEYEITALEATNSDSAKHKAMTTRYWWRNSLSSRFVLAETQKNVFYRVYYGFLGQEEEWNIPVFSALDWFSDWRLRNPEARKSMQEEGIARYLKWCDSE